jgi:hypothetical protein
MMNLTTMKVSVPVLMLMMFQSGYGVSDWFAKAWSAMNEGKKAEAFAIVQQAKPEKVGTLSAEQKTEFRKTWSKEISDAVTNILPQYYYDANGKLTADGESLRNTIVTLTNDEIDTSVGDSLGDLAKQNSQDQITKDSVNAILRNRIAIDVPGFIGQDHNWLLPDDNYVSGEAAGVGINRWVKDLISNWGGENYTQEDNKKLLLGKFDNNDFELRAKIQLGGVQNNDENYKNQPEVNDVFNAVKTCEIPAGGTNSGQLDPAKTEEITVSLRNALLDVLAARATDNAAGNNNAANYATDGPGDLFVRTYRDRVVTVNTSKTVINYGDSTTAKQDPLTVIFEKAGTTLDVANIKNAVDNVISADLSHILRHSGSVSVDTLDNNIASSSETVHNDKVEEGLQSVAQTFDDATASSIVSNLKAIKTNQP